MNHGALAAHRSASEIAHVGALADVAASDKAILIGAGLLLGAGAAYALTRRPAPSVASIETSRDVLIPLERGSDGRYQWYNALSKSVVYNYSGNSTTDVVRFDRTENAPRVRIGE